MSKVFSNTAFFKYVYTVFFFVKALVLPFKSVSISEHSEENSYGFKHVKVIKHQSVVLVCYMAVASANCHISQKFRSWSCSPLLLSVQFLCKPVSFVSVLWQRKQLLQQEWSEPNRQLHQESHPYGAPRQHHGPVRGFCNHYDLRRDWTHRSQGCCWHNADYDTGTLCFYKIPHGI